MTTTKDNRIAELEKQLADAVQDKSALVDQLAVSATKDSRIVELEKQITANDHNHRMDIIKVTRLTLTYSIPAYSIQTLSQSYATRTQICYTLMLFYLNPKL